MDIKPTIFSGVQPSGNLHLGNYLGAISQWVDLQKDHNCIFCVVDYHAITVPQDPMVLKQKIVEIAKIYLASGIDPEKSIIFQQSAVKEHTELGWILNTITQNGDLAKMTQFKDKSGIQNDFNIQQFNKVGVGLFDYPVLMAADILLYDTDAVPVGEDQAQHVELARTLARRFNSRFGETFKVPELIIRKEGARIMGLDDPEKKMSKSAKSELNYIALTDDPARAAKKIMKAITDSGAEIKYDLEKKPAISNLLTIYSLLSGDPIKDLEKKYKGSGYGGFKKDLAEVVSGFLGGFQKKLASYSDADVKNILSLGADSAKIIAEKTIRKTKENIGVYIE
jgi:tryptophanyl-tRNA synthetase